MCVETATEVQVCHFVVAFAHAAGCADDSPDGQTAAEGNEGLFAEAAPYLVEGVFAVEVGILVKGRGKRRAVGRSHSRHDGCGGGGGGGGVACVR